MRKPDFVIVGMPKSGTTALYHYLKEHPQIFMAQPKEPHFFGTDLPDFHIKFSKLEDYIAIYNDVADEQICGEASIQYLFSNVALKALLKFQPKVKCVAIVRNPIDMAISLHNQCVKTLDENEEDFEKAWNLQKSRAVGEHIPKNCRHSGQLQYYDYCKVGTQLKKLVSLVPPDQRYIILYDDFANNPSETYKKLLKFLSVDDDDRKNFKKHNFSILYKNKKIAEMIKKPGPFIRLLKSYLKKPLNKIGIYPSLFIQNLNSEKNKSPLSSEFKKELINIFQPEIEMVEEILKTDLKEWKIYE